MKNIEPLDLTEMGAPIDDQVQRLDRRLFMQLLVFSHCDEPRTLIPILNSCSLESVLYLDMNDPKGVAILLFSEDPNKILHVSRMLMEQIPFKNLIQKNEYTMLGRTYSSGREVNLKDWLIDKPRRTVLNPELVWAIWYPLRRKGEFELLSRAEKGKILGEHAMIGRCYGEAGFVSDVRLACHGLDKNDNDFVIGILGSELYPLSRIVQDMRMTQQTAKFMSSLGPFFVAKVFWQSPLKS